MPAVRGAAGALKGRGKRPRGVREENARNRVRCACVFGAGMRLKGRTARYWDGPRAEAEGVEAPVYHAHG